MIRTFAGLGLSLALVAAPAMAQTTGPERAALLARLNAARSAGAPVMTRMLSLLDPREVGELRGYLERCVEGLEGATGSQREAPATGRERRARGESRTTP